jgi:hypothetical protein
MTEPWLLNRFQRSKKLGQYWYNHASDLRAGALVLWHSYDDKKVTKVINGESIGLGPSFSLKAALPGVYRMLAGLSLELLLKACIVKRDGDDSNVPTKHDLIELANIAGFKPRLHEKNLLKIFSVYSVWLGKYPVPKKEKEFNDTWDFFNEASPKEKLGKFTVYKPLVINKRKYRSLWNRIHHLYNSIEAKHKY